MIKLDFVVIGGQKCGSTFLQTVINAHPEIDMSSGECPHFESPDYENGGIQKLEVLLSKLNNTKKIGIKRPNYLSNNEVRKRLSKVNEQIKLIVILRNPIERLKSAYFHNMNYGFSPVLSLNEGIQKLIAGKLKKKYPRTEELIEFGYYAKYLKDYTRDFDDRLLILFYDQLKKDKLDIIKKCYLFLGVDTDFIPNDIFLNSRPQKVNYSLFRTRLLTTKNRYQFNYNATRTRLEVKKQNRIDKFVCKNIDRIDRRIVSKYLVEDKKPIFTPKVHNQLIDIYQQDINELESICNVDLSHWKDFSA
jgi:hypothetical protein|tara:strand:- start:82 stop:996 length:915 start_codon:yes stop_codon:yes gene_type:complete